MAEYIVVSFRVGVPGAPWHPREGVNVQALLDAGFIRRAEAREPSPTHPNRSRVKPKPAPDTEPTE